MFKPNKVHSVVVSCHRAVNIRHFTSATGLDGYLSRDHSSAGVQDVNIHGYSSDVWH